MPSMSERAVALSSNYMRVTHERPIQAPITASIPTPLPAHLGRSSFMLSSLPSIATVPEAPILQTHISAWGMPIRRMPKLGTSQQ